MTSSATANHPVFVGGTGRSGTTIMGELIGSSAHHALIPVEVRFHAERDGLPAFARGRISANEFRSRFDERWFERAPNRSGPRGVHVISSRTVVDAAFEEMLDSDDADRWSASGRFLRHVFGAFAEGAGKPTWVEMTPPNAKSAHDLARMLPEAHVVVMERDGRDVASSVVPRTWGPKTMPDALRWWTDQMIAIARSSQAVPAERLSAIRLESLTGPGRDAVLEELTTFVGVPGDTGMRHFLHDRITAESARGGRWRQGVSDADIQQIEQLYATELERMRENDVRMAAVIG